MGWWQNFTQQANELVQQLLYALELAVAGGEDAPWIDTLNFLWDSLPDADKLTTAERRRLARHMKQIVREQVQKHYTQELAQKEAIHKRQTTREALAHQRLQQLAEARRRQMQVLSETARQQSMLLPEDMPAVVHGDALWTPFDRRKSSPSPWPLLPSQSWHWRQQQQQKPRQQVMPGRVVRVSSGTQVQQQCGAVQRKVSTGSSSSGTNGTRGSRLQYVSSSHVILNIADCDSDSSSSNSSEIKPLFEGFAARCLGMRTTDEGVDEGLQQPLLHSPKSPFAAAHQQQQGALWDTQQQQQQEQGGRQYEPPLQAIALPVDQLQQADHLQQQLDRNSIAGLHSDDNNVPARALLLEQNATEITAEVDQHKQQQQQQQHIAPAGPEEDISQFGSQLLLERYLSAASSGPGSTADTAAIAAAAAAAVATATGRGPSLRLCSAECGVQQPLGLLYDECEGNLVQSESEPPSECSAAVSSVGAEQQSCGLCCGHVSDVATKAADTAAAAAMAVVKSVPAAGDVRVAQRA